MADLTLTIVASGQVRRVHMNPPGAVLGRNPDCDVVIDSPEVSRRHAEIAWTPPGVWVIKDLGSSNGTFVNGTRVESCPITANDLIGIGPVSLLLGESTAPQVPAALLPQQPKITIEDFGIEVFYDKPRIEECAMEPYPQRLGEVRKRLSQLTDPGAVYPEVCRALAQGAGVAAAIFRVPGDGPLRATAEVVAYHFGSSPGDTLARKDHARDPFHRGFRVSHRLLEAVRTSGRPLMTKSIFSCDTQITISWIDEHSPRALMCVPIGSPKDVTDLLYVDVPIDDRMEHGPEEMFAFVQAVVRRATDVTASATA